MAKKRDYYDILGVKRTASADEIRSAYRKLGRKLHPDVNKAKNAAEQFSEVQEAYDVLSDDEKRKAYDRFGHAGAGASAPGGPGGARTGYGPGGVRWSYSTGGAGESGFEDISSIFEEMFGGAPGSAGAGRAPGGSPFGGARASRARAARPQRGRDISHSFSVAFNTAALGGTQQLRIQRDGRIETIDVKIPAGVQSGAKLRVRGKGEPGPAGGQAGDLMLTVDIAPHPYFRRDGFDVMLDVPINIAEAALGVSVTVPLLTGSAELRIPPGASSGQKLRLKGKGIPNTRGAHGDLYAVIQIVAPKDLSEKGRKLLGELAGELKNPRESAPWADDLKE